MSFRKSVGNMYPWVTHTWNVIKGKCPHDCSYCYMKRFPQGELRFDEKEMKRNLGEGRFIFVGSSCDMWADNIPGKWIAEVIGRCYQYPENKYLFQSKNPTRFTKSARDYFSPNMTLATTIESNRIYPHLGNAPEPLDRAESMRIMRICGQACGFDTIVTIEPILDFDIPKMVELLKIVSPKWVNIGADTKGHNLPEPSWEKVQDLISALKEFTEVKVKSNLERLNNGINR